MIISFSLSGLKFTYKKNRQMYTESSEYKIKLQKNKINIINNLSNKVSSKLF